LSPLFSASADRWTIEPSNFEPPDRLTASSALSVLLALCTYSNATGSRSMIVRTPATPG